MYKSPIEKIYGEIQTQMVQEDENMVMKAIRKVGVNADKEELIKALQYDRNQYTKGYEDGKNDVLDKIRAEIMDFEEELFHRPNTDYADYAAVRHCVEIIDEYRAESENT